MLRIAISYNGSPKRSDQSRPPGGTLWRSETNDGPVKAIISFSRADYRLQTALQLAIDLAVTDRIRCIINV